MVKPEIMLCETVLNLSTLHYITAQYPVTWRHVIGLVRQLSCLKLRPQISFLLGPGCKSGRLQSVVYKRRSTRSRSRTLMNCVHVSWQFGTKWISALLIKQSDSGTHVFVHALTLKADTLNIHCVS